MPKTKKKTELKDYYACVTVEVIVYFQASDEENAESVAESIIDHITIDSNTVCESIDYDGHTITEIALHD